MFSFAQGAGIRYHDVRYTGKMPIQQQTVTNTSVPSVSPATPPPPQPAAVEQEGKQSDTETEEQLKKKEEDIDLSSDGYFTQSSDGAVNNSASSDAIQLQFSKEAAPSMIPKDNSDSDIPACEAENAVTHDAPNSDSPRAAEALPGAQVIRSSDEVGLPSSKVYGRSSASPHFITTAGEGKLEVPQATREVRSLTPQAEPSEPRGKFSGFNRMVGSASDCSQVVLIKGEFL